MPGADKEFLTIAELAALLQVNRKAVMAWTRRGMPHLRLGRSVRIPREKALAWLETGAASPPPQSPSLEPSQPENGSAPARVPRAQRVPTYRRARPGQSA